MDTNNAGWRGRLGILVIDMDAIAEVEFWTISPPGMTVHAARFEAPRLDWNDSGRHDLAREVAESADLARSLEFLGRIGLDAICLCYTTASFYGGRRFDTEFSQLATKIAHAVPAFTSALAMKSAMNALGICKPFIVAPAWFTQDMTSAAERYFSADAQATAGAMRFDLGPGWRELDAAQAWAAGAQWEVRSADVYRQVRRSLPTGADGVVIAGNGFGSAQAAAALETDLSVPVVTANQACVWYFLQTMRTRVPVQGYGRLLAGPATLRPE
jgi:maleate isomerase